MPRIELSTNNCLIKHQKAEKYVAIHGAFPPPFRKIPTRVPCMPFIHSLKRKKKAASWITLMVGHRFWFFAHATRPGRKQSTIKHFSLLFGHLQLISKTNRADTFNAPPDGMPPNVTNYQNFKTGRWKRRTKGVCEIWATGREIFACSTRSKFLTWNWAQRPF